MKPEDESWMGQMREAAREALLFAEGHRRQSLKDDRRTQLAIVGALIAMSESASRVSLEMQTLHRQIPWADIIGLRHHLQLGFYEVDPEVAWITVRDELTPVVEALTSALPALSLSQIQKKKAA